MSDARLAAERAGLQALQGHPAAPELLGAADGLWILADFGSPADAVAAVRSWPRAQSTTLCLSRRKAMRQLCPERDLPKLLFRIGVSRRRVDRWLDEELELEVRVGPSVGGLVSGWLRMTGAGAKVLRCDRAGPNWLSFDLAALGLGQPAAVRSGLAEENRRGASSDDAANAAYDLCAVTAALREYALDRNETWLRDVRSPLAGRRSPAPERVSVWIEGLVVPRPRAWPRLGEEVGLQRARELVGQLDGKMLAGGLLRVRTDPVITGLRRTPQREDRRARRQRLFSRWTEGVRVDREGLLSATPEALAERMVEGVRGEVVDGTCGVGSIAIALARLSSVTRVIALDVDAERLEMAAHNAAIYGVRDRIEFVQADVRQSDVFLEADLLVLDPPWGGRDYDRNRLGLADLPLDVRPLLERVPGSVLLKLPRSFAVDELRALSGPPFSFELMVDDRGITKFLVARRGPRGKSEPPKAGTASPERTG